MQVIYVVNNPVVDLLEGDHNQHKQDKLVGWFAYWQVGWLVAGSLVGWWVNSLIGLQVGEIP